MFQFIVLTGPTGTGKSAVGLALAHHLPIEIVNGDMGQLYTPLNIGTAKPTTLERELVPHHLFDLLDDPVNFTVAQYRARVQSVMREIWARKNIPVVVGGSGFYIKALFFPAAKSESEHSHMHSPTNRDRAHSEFDASRCLLLSLSKDEESEREDRLKKQNVISTYLKINCRIVATTE